MFTTNLEVALAAAASLIWGYVVIILTGGLSAALGA